MIDRENRTYMDIKNSESRRFARPELQTTPRAASRRPFPWVTLWSEFFQVEVGEPDTTRHTVYTCIYVCLKRSLPWNSGQLELTRLFRTEQGGLSRGSCSGGLWWRIGTYRPGLMSREDKIQLSRYRCADKQPQIYSLLYVPVCHYGLTKRFLEESLLAKIEKSFAASVSDRCWQILSMENFSFSSWQ